VSGTFANQGAPDGNFYGLQHGNYRSGRALFAISYNASFTGCQFSIEEATMWPSWPFRAELTGDARGKSGHGPSACSASAAAGNNAVAVSAVTMGSLANPSMTISFASVESLVTR